MMVVYMFVDGMFIWSMELNAFNNDKSSINALISSGLILKKSNMLGLE
jgi:hypothetical protein